MSHLIPLPAPGVPADEPLVRSFRVPLHDAVATVRRRHRSLITAAGRWALVRGLALPGDHVALWAAAAGGTGRVPAGADPTAGVWRASRIPELLAAIAAWCTRAGCSPPADLAASLWHLFGFLADTGRLDPRSDSLSELRAAIVVFAGFDGFRPVPPRPPDRAAA